MTLNSIFKDLEKNRKMYEGFVRPGPATWINEMKLGGALADQLKGVRLYLESPIFQANGLLSERTYSWENLGHIAEGLRIGQEKARILAQVQSPILSQSLVESTAALGRVAEQLAAVRVGSPMGVKPVSALLTSGLGPVARALDISLAGQAAVAAIQLPQIGALVGLGSRERLRLEASFGRQAKAFAVLQTAVEQIAASRLSELPILTQLPAVHVFTNADVIRVTSVTAEEDVEMPSSMRVEVAEEITDALPALLEAVDPRLVKMWLGAREALRSDNPDRMRHVIVSLRNLFDHVFWTLAPDAEVSSWTRDPKHYHAGRLTRNARILYICRAINYGPLTTYVKKSVAALLEFYNLFGGGTHAAEDRFTEEQLSVMLTHAEGHLRFLIEVSHSRAA